MFPGALRSRRCGGGTLKTFWSRGNPGGSRSEEVRAGAGGHVAALWVKNTILNDGARFARASRAPKTHGPREYHGSWPSERPELGPPRGARAGQTTPKTMDFPQFIAVRRTPSRSQPLSRHNFVLFNSGPSKHTHAPGRRSFHCNTGKVCSVFNVPSPLRIDSARASKPSLVALPPAAAQGNA